MDRFMQRVSQLVDDSIPQRKLLLYLASQDLAVSSSGKQWINETFALKEPGELAYHNMISLIELTKMDKGAVIL
jgi:hypothetical protein